jgi:hypothetical protein
MVAWKVYLWPVGGEMNPEYRICSKLRINDVIRIWSMLKLEICYHAKYFKIQEAGSSTYVNQPYMQLTPKLLMSSTQPPTAVVKVWLKTGWILVL